MENIAHVVYINLDKREDRRKEMEAELQKMGIQAERFSAIEKRPGSLGCHLSHIAVLQQAKQLNLPNILILEDDFEFLTSKEELNTQLTTFFQSKTEYDVLMLSYNVYKSKPFNKTVSRAIEVQTTSGYIVNSRFYDKLLNCLETNYTLLEKTGNEKLYLIDQCWKSLQKDHMFLYFNKRLGKQRPSFSDLVNKVVDYNC